MTVAAPPLPLPARQRRLLLRAQHVHDRDDDRARRLRGVPDRAAAIHARVGFHGQRPRTSRASMSHASASLNRPDQPLRRGALDARRVRPDDRLDAGSPGALEDGERPVGAVPFPDGVRDRGDRQPLHRRRHPRGAHSRRLRLRRELAGARACHRHGASRPSLPPS